MGDKVYPINLLEENVCKFSFYKLVPRKNVPISADFLMLYFAT